MKNPLLIIFLCLICHSSFSQKRTLPRIVLDSMMANNDRFGNESSDDEGRYIVDPITGESTFISSQQQKGTTNKRVASNLILVDTFGFFPPLVDKRSGLKVVNELPHDIQPRAANVFWIAGIATGRNDALAIGVFYPITNGLTVYYFSIMGKDIHLIKRTSGNF